MSLQTALKKHSKHRTKHKKSYNVCFTGAMMWTREEMHQIAKARGHNPQPRVTKTTDLLVLADFKSLSLKAQRARRDGAKLLTAEAWLNLPLNASAKKLDEYIEVHMFEEVLKDYDD